MTNSVGANKKRLFVAIPIPPKVCGELQEVQNALKPFARDAKWVRVDGIHLTLKFLGYVDVGKIESMQRNLQKVSEIHSPVSIRVQGCGFFPNERKPRVLWTGVASERLSSLHDSIEGSMADLGFEKESRAFSPHLTLARFRDTRGRMPLVQESRKWQDAELGAFIASEFILYESILRPRGAQYVKLSGFPLKLRSG